MPFFILLCPVFSVRPFINEKLKSSTTNFGNTIPRIVEDAIEESSKKSKFGLTLGFVTLGVILKNFWQSTSDFLQRCGFQIAAFKESFVSDSLLAGRHRPFRHGRMQARLAKDRPTSVRRRRTLISISRVGYFRLCWTEVSCLKMASLETGDIKLYSERFSTFINASVNLLNVKKNNRTNLSNGETIISFFILTREGLLFIF